MAPIKTRNILPMFCVHCKNTFKLEGVPLDLLPVCPHCNTQMRAYDLHQGAMILMRSAMLQVRRASALIQRHDNESPAGRESIAVLNGLDSMIGSLISTYGEPLALDNFDNDNGNAIGNDQALQLTKKLGWNIPTGKVTRF